MSRDLYGEPDIDPYVFYESPWNDYSVSGRSKSVPATTWAMCHADSRRMCSRNEMNGKLHVTVSKINDDDDDGDGDDNDDDDC